MASDLGEKLDAAGLDPEFWKPIFKTELDITKGQQIVHLEFDDIDILEKHCRRKWEKNALKSLLNQNPAGRPGQLSIDITSDNGRRHGTTSDVHDVPGVPSSNNVNRWDAESLNLHSNLGQEPPDILRREKPTPSHISTPSKNPNKLDDSSDLKRHGRTSDVPNNSGMPSENLHWRGEESGNLHSSLGQEPPNTFGRNEGIPINVSGLSENPNQLDDSPDWERNKETLVVTNEPGTPSDKGYVKHCINVFNGLNQEAPNTSRKKKVISASGPSENPSTQGVSSDLTAGTQSSDRPFRQVISSCLNDEEMFEGEVGPHKESLDSVSCEKLRNSKADFLQILEKLGLKNYYPSKMTFRQVMKIRKEQDENNMSAEDLPWSIMRKVVMTDSTARDDVLRKWNETGAQKDSSKNPSDVLGMFEETSLTPDEAVPHPLDVFLAIFTSCDLMLKQALLQKMFMCRLAIPLIYPDPIKDSSVLSVWALRKISVEWVDKSKKVLEENVVNGKNIKTVSFLRYGCPMISKSQILNNVVESPTHCTFFDRDCSLGDAERLVANGLVEATWYIPSGSEQDVFQDCIMFLNMRGNAEKHGETMQVIRMISKVMVIVIDAHANEDIVQQMMTEISEQAMVLFIVNVKPGSDFESAQKMLKRIMSNSSAIKIVLTVKKSGKKLVEKNASELKIEIQGAINELLKGNQRSQSPISIEDLAMKCSMIKNISIDEMDSKCQGGKKLAKEILQNIQKKEIKDILPLQQDTWMTLSKLLKESERSKFDDMNKKDEITQRMKNIRHTQFERCKTLDSIVKKFVLVLNNEQGEDLTFLLEWLKVILDERTREVLPELYKVYHMKRQSMKDGQGKHDKAYQQKCRIDVETSEEDIARSSFGLEHLFREIGQIFEAFAIEGQIETDPFIKNLPKFVAKLLTNGVPLEIMDGDSGCVPSTWVNAVLEALQALIGNRKIFVISVLGIQSSGKSTMLNAMFGLQFPVSAGRCTRGVYLQLVEVDKNCSFGFDYVFVVDTEGLRAPELGSVNYTHDNELATLVTGLGDVTIMNIKGENLSEMQDVLQIIVHAFLRMKAVNNRIELKKKCVFIHQNVSAVNAREKMGFGTNKMTDTLDEMAKEAASQEKILSVNRFKDIIDFDENKHVQTIPDLWQGDPPMAAVNPGYSEKVNKIKQYIVNPSKIAQESFMSISDFTVHLKDLWNGVLREDFVFSFKNTLALKAYMEMESKYSELTWNLQNNMNQLMDEVQIKISQVSSESILDDCCHIEMKGYDDKLSKDIEKTKEELERYFNECSQKDIAIQWKNAKLKSLVVLKQDLLNRLKSDMVSMKEAQKVHLMQTNEFGNHEEEIMQKAKKVALQMKEQKEQGQHLGEEELKKEFEKMWKNWISGIQHKKPVREISIKQEVERILYEEFQESRSFLKEQLQKPRVPHFLLDVKDIKPAHFSFKAPFYKPNWILKGSNTQKALTSANKILKDINIYLTDIGTRSKFIEFYAVDLIKRVKKAVNKENNLFVNDSFSLTIGFEVMVAVHVCFQAIPVFQRIEDKYIEKYNVTTKLEKYRSKVWNLFRNFVEDRNLEIIAADLLLDAIKPAMLTTILRSLKTDIVNEVVCDIVRKPELIGRLLDDLATKEEFDSYSLYLANPKSFALKWITNYTKERVLGEKHVSKMAHFTDLASKHIHRINKDLVDATKRVAAVKSSADWARNFLNAMHGKIDLTSSDFTEFERCPIVDFRNLNDNLLERIETLDDWAIKEIETEYAKDISWGDSSPYQLATDRLWGCEALCPYCQEPCNKADAKHFENDETDLHLCAQHKPVGIAGGHWKDTDILVIHPCDFAITTNYSKRCSRRTCKDYKEHKLQAGDERIYHPYKEYKKHRPEWDIYPNNKSDENKYWMFFMHKFNNELAEWYQHKPAEIPETWKSIKLQDALDSLRLYSGSARL